MASNTNEDSEQTMKTLELKKSTCEKKNELVKTAQQMNEHETPVGEAICNARKKERKNLTEKNADTSLLRRSCPDEQIKRLRDMFESIEDMLSTPDYDVDLQSELSDKQPNFNIALQTAKRDLLRNDCGIVVAGEISAGKTTLINLLVKKEVFATNNLAATGRITRIRNSESMKIKCYSKDEELQMDEDFKDEHILKSSIKRLTKITDGFNDIHYVDVYLPVSILKGNVIIIDTPGIGETEMMDNMLLEFLPHAVAFVFVVNAKNAGGIHEDRLLKILKALENNKDEMPCFDPKDALFLTNQWDAIRNYPASSDEDDDQHAQTKKFILTKLRKGWIYLSNIFHTSLQQVEDGVENKFTNDYKKFEEILKNTIEKNRNKRVVFYHGCLKDFIRNAETGILARLKQIDNSESESVEMIRESNAKIKDLEENYKKSKIELEIYKTKVISDLANKLNAYLQSMHGMDRVLNPHEEIRIDNVKLGALREVVHSRVERGIQEWCQIKDVESIIRDADEKITSKVDAVLSQLKEIEIEMTGIHFSVDSVIFLDQNAFELSMQHFGTLLSMIFLILTPLYFVKEWLIGPEGRRRKAEELYHDCIKSMPLSKLEESFERSFGVEYSKVIDGIFNISLPKIIADLRITNNKLVYKHMTIKRNKTSLLRLKEKIQLAAENFKMIYNECS